MCIRDRGKDQLIKKCDKLITKLENLNVVENKLETQKVSSCLLYTSITVRATEPLRLNEIAVPEHHSAVMARSFK